MASRSLVCVDFEVFGKVQGVFFRKLIHLNTTAMTKLLKMDSYSNNEGNTQKTAAGLGLVGWVKNTKNCTVVGHAEGDETKIKSLKTWLQTKGSPASRIDKCVFSNENTISNVSTSSFTIVK